MVTEPGAGLALLESPVRRAIVDHLANVGGTGEGLTAQEVAERVALHVTTARFHLDQLESHGLVESSFRRGAVGRPRKLYRTAQRGLAPSTLPPAASEDAHRALTALLAEGWHSAAGDEPLSPEQAGRRWALGAATPADQPPAQARTAGGWLGKVGATVDLLHRWGYLPELRTEDGGRTAELTLVGCPFLELATTRPEVVCGIHRGLLRGAMEAYGEPDTDVALVPLVAPRTCLARVTTRADFT